MTLEEALVEMRKTRTARCRGLRYRITDNELSVESYNDTDGNRMKWQPLSFSVPLDGWELEPEQKRCRILVSNSQNFRYFVSAFCDARVANVIEIRSDDRDIAIGIARLAAERLGYRVEET